MAQRDLYVDTNDGSLVTSNTDQTPAPFPPLIQGDTISFRVFLLQRTVSFPNAQPIYTIINNAGMTMRMGIGPKDGTPGSTLYTSQFTWTASADNTYFAGDFPLNTTGIGSIIGTGENASLWFEIEITNSNGLPWTVFQRKVPVQAEVIESAAIDVPGGQVGLTQADADARYLRRQISGIIYLEDINNPGQFIALFNQDGSLQVQNVGGTLPP